MDQNSIKDVLTEELSTEKAIRLAVNTLAKGQNRKERRRLMSKFRREYRP